MIDLFGNKTIDKVESPFSKSLLKSAIQKAVRRGEEEKALRCAKSLIASNLNDYARRLPVIVLEDSLLHPDFDKLIEITKKASRKNYLLSEEEANLLLTITGDIARTEIRDFIIDNPDKIDNYSKIDDDKLSFLKAIKYRTFIGGMKDDIVMLNDFIKIWSYRFSHGWDREKIRSLFKTKPIKYDEVDFCTEEDILLETVDFHCSPMSKIILRKDWVVKELKTSFPNQEPEDMLNKIVWCLRSGVNNKKIFWNGKTVNWLEADKIPSHQWEDFKRIYNLIKYELDDISKWFIKKQIERS